MIPANEAAAPSTGKSPLADRLLTVAEVSEMLQVAAIFVYRHAAELGAFKVGSHLRFNLQEVERWLFAQRLQSGPDEECRSPVENELMERLVARSRRVK